MKTRALAFFLVAAMVSVGGMCSKPKKSSENQIATFTVNNVAYTDINHATGLITYHYSKATANTWEGLPSTWPNLTATITLKDPQGAKITPDPGVAQNYKDGTARFTVTAEDGTPKEYKVLVSRQEEL